MKEQKSSIINLLKLKNDKSESVWKVMIYDQFCKDVLSTIFKVGTLRELKISLHMNIKDQKQPIKGINTIYLI